MLSEKDIRILDFEAGWWHFPEPKDRAIRDYLGMSSTRYYQALRRLVDDDDAAQQYPLVIKRLRKMKEDRKKALAKRIDTPVGG
jgi:hypothetical protein